MWAPPHTPKPIVETLNANVVARLKTPELLGGLHRAGFEPLPIGANAIGAFMQSESPKWLEVAKTSGVKGD
jgi:tripartite-type tricarboxylate transporter receptor subunit TctC